MPVIRATIANVSPAWLAEDGQRAGLAGTVEASTGFGSWGREDGATVELTVPSVKVADVDAWLAGILKARHEEAAYLTVDGRDGALLFADGSKKPLDTAGAVA